MTLQKNGYLFIEERVHPEFPTGVLLAFYEYKNKLYPMADGWREVLSDFITCTLPSDEYHLRDVLERIIRFHKSDRLECNVPMLLNAIELPNPILPTSATKFATIRRRFSQLEEECINPFLNKRGYSLQNGKLVNLSAIELR